jgi:NitT/TauT family transport system substrate-binding protein
VSHGWIPLALAGLLSACGAGNAASPAAPASSAAVQPSIASAGAPKPAASAVGASAPAKPAASGAASAAAKPAASAAAKPGAIPSSSANLTTVKSAWNTITANQSPVWVAQSKGLFQQQGINVDLSFIEGSVAALPALTKGDVSIIESTPTAAIQGKIKGLDTVVLGAHIPYINQRLVATSDIKTFADLKHKTIAATKAGSSDDFTLHLVLAKEGWAPSDVQITYVGEVPAQVAALSSHQVQAIVVSPPSNLAAEKVGGHEILNFYDLKIPYPGDGVVSTRAYVSQHRDLVVDYLKAYVSAIRYIKSHPDEAKQVIADYTKQDDKTALDTTYDALVQVLPDDPTPNPAGIQTILDAVDGGKGQNPADFIDATPMADAIKALGK